MASSYESLRDSLLIQCTAREPSTVFPLLDRPGTGLVVTEPRRNEIRALAATAHRAEKILLVDAQRYRGRHRKLAREPFDPAWISTQRDADLPVLSDSGYVDAGDEAGLTAILGRARSDGDCIATLPLHRSWLDHARGLGYLLDQVAAAQVPVAVVLEHPDDPYGARYVLAGMRELLAVGVPVVQLRCDLSALGLLSHGAISAAVGTRTGLRHLYPASSGGGGGGRPPTVATVVADLLAFVAVDRIATAVRADPEDSLWQPCECPSCGGRQLNTLAQLSDPARTERSFGHAVHALLDLRDALVPRGSSPVDRRLSWRAHCGSALHRYAELGGPVSGWNAPPALRHWHDVPVPVAADR